MLAKGIDKGADLTYSSTGSDNGLVPNRRHAITWSNDGIC